MAEENIEFPLRRKPKFLRFVTPRRRKVIINAYQDKLTHNPDAKIVDISKSLSEELGIRRSTIYQTIMEYKWSKEVAYPDRTKKSKTVKNKVDYFDKCAIRRKIHQYWIGRKLPTFKEIYQVIKEDEILPNISCNSLSRLLKSMDFECVKPGCNKAITEKTEIVLWRRKYLREIRQYRKEGRPIYYLGETRVNAGDIPSIFGCHKPSGRGELLIICHIGSEDGFVTDGLLCFEPKKNTQGYQDKINGECFREWFERVLPKLKNNAVIVIDNTLYHSIEQEEGPTGGRKADIIAWLESKGEIVDTSMVVRELLQVVDRLRPIQNKYFIDDIAKIHNKQVLQLPPYHCKLNPIELAWSAVNIYIRMNNFTTRLCDVKQLLVEGVQRTNSEVWKNCIEYAVAEEEKMWNMDFVVDELMAVREPCPLNVESNAMDLEDEVRALSGV